MVITITVGIAPAVTMAQQVETTVAPPPPLPSGLIVYDIDANNQLLGARNIDVAGTLFDVEFLDGTCVSLFTGCDDSGDFVFANGSDAQAASIALLEQVFLDVEFGDFDTTPSLTRGIDHELHGVILTPYIVAHGVLQFATVNNYSVEAVDNIQLGQLSAGVFTFVTGESSVWAVWKVATDVPEPSTVILLFLGFAGLSFARYRRQS